MKARIIQIACIAIITSAIGSFAAKAQDYFFDVKRENGKAISKIKYEIGYSKSYEKTYLFEYSYDGSGNLLTEDVYKWDGKKSAWAPDHRTIRKYDSGNNVVLFECATWDGIKKQYGNSIEKMIYQLDDSKNILTYLAFIKNNKIEEEINTRPNDYTEKLVFK